MSDVREDAAVKAERLGLTLVTPKDDELFIDLDSEAYLAMFQARFKLLRLLCPTATVTCTQSVHNNHHAYVVVPELAPLTDHERIALQAALGSDPFREMLAIQHGRAGYKYTSCFFEVPERAAAREATEARDGATTATEGHSGRVNAITDQIVAAAIATSRALGGGHV